MSPVIKISVMKQHFHFSDTGWQQALTRSLAVIGFLLFIPFTLHAQLNAVISGDATVCQGSASPVVTFTGSGGTAPYTFTYTLNGAGNQVIVSDAGGDIASIAVPTDSPATYIYSLVSVEDAVSAYQAVSGSVTINIISVPLQPGAISGLSFQCPNTSGQVYSVSEVSGATSYNWTVPAGWTINSGAGTATISVTTGSSGGTVSVTASNICGSSTASSLSVAVGVLSTAPTGISITDNNTCFGTVKTLSVTGGSLGTGAVWEWFTGSCGGTSAGTGESISVNPAAATTTSYYVRASGTCNTTACATGTVIVPANVGTPSVPTPSAGTICQGTASTTFTTSAANATGYVWSVSGAGNTVSGTGPTATVNWSAAFSGVAVISVYATGCGGPSATVSTTMTVRPTPTASISGSVTVCQNAPSPVVTFTNPQSLPVNGSNEANINVGANSFTTLTIPTTSTGSFTYNLKSVVYQTAPTCAAPVSGSATVTVEALPLQPTITADGPLTFCNGEDVVLTSSAGSSYLWSTGATTQSITVTAAGNYTVQVTNASGCLSIPSSITEVKVYPLPSIPTINPPGPISLCAGGSQLLASSSGVTYLWSTGETTSSISVNTTGDYTVRVTNSYGCLSLPSLATSVTVNPLPDAPVITSSGPTTFCEGGSVTLTSTASSAYLWSTGATTRSITVNSSGSYWVRITDANGCQSPPSLTTSVTVNPLPDAPSTGLVTQPTCTVSTGSVVLNDLPAGSWTINPGNITGSTSTTTVTGLAAGSYTFTVTNSSGCTSVPSAQVNINNPPAVPTTPVVDAVTQPTCTVSTGSVGFSGLPITGIWTLTRLPDGITSTGTGSTTIITGIPSGNYTFTVTNASDCVSPATGTVTINDPLPVPPAPVQSTDCTLGAGLASVTVISPVAAGYEYRLDAGDYQTSNIFLNVANGNHTITVRNLSGCTTTGPTFSVNCGCLNPPSVTLSASSGNTCGTAMVTVSGNTFGGGATMVTITDDGGGTVTPASSATSPFSFSYTPVTEDAGKVVIITVTTDNPAGDPCAAASATYALTVNPIPPAPVPGTVTHPTCLLPTGSVMLNNLPASGEWTITRSPGDATMSGSGTSITVTGLAPDTYTFIVTNSLGCTSPASADVVINAQPATPGAPVVDLITQPTCALSTGSVALSGLPAVGTWTLIRSPGNVSTTGTGTTRTVTGINPGTYTYTVTNASGCVSPASEPVVIDPQPITPNTPTIGTITHPTCELATGSIVLENMPEEGEWILIRYPGGITSTGIGSSITISTLPTGIYNFAVTNADGCTSQVSANAVINAQPPTPTPPVVGTITHPTFTVATGSVVLSGLPSTGIWTLTRYPDGFTSQGTGTTRTVSGLEPGTYTFTVTNSVGCTSAPTGDVVINARPGAPVVIINNPATICSNETTDLTSAAVTAGSDANLTFTYWTDAAATIPYSTPTEAPAGTYYIKGTSTAGYYSIKEVVVTADQLPVANAGADQELNYVFGTTLTADIPEIGAGIWELVTGTGDLFNSTAPSTFVSGLSEGENIFSWTVTNGACDPVSDDVIVKVNNLKIPTLITPNQDGRNDSFRLLGLETLGRTELTIFDRRGLKVYENSDYDNSWEGLDYNSRPLPDDTYFYVIRAENGVSLSGYIVVRR